MATKNITMQILEALKQAGVDKIFGIAGGGPTADMISLAPKAGIDFVLTQHETTAVITAGIYGQMKGTVGVAVSAIGPGVANFANGTAHAYCDRLPVLMFADRYSGGVHDVALRQQFDHLTFMRPITKAQITLHESTFMTGLRRAVRTALSERQGPVFIDFPGNVATTSANQQVYKLKKAGGNKLLVVELWETYQANDFLMSNGLATMGFCIPAAIAAKMAHPKRPVVALCGDAGFMMRLPDLLTVQRLKQKIVFVIFADDEHSLISSKQIIKGLPKYGMDFPRPNYQAMAKTFGMKGVTVNNPKELKQAIADGLKHDTSTIIEARIDPSGYAKQFDVIREL